MTPLVALRGLTIAGPERLLVRDVDVEVIAGEVTALTGPSGSGKSLTAQACMGVVDVLPGLARGSLRTPPLSGDKDWFAPAVGAGEAGHRRLLRETASLRGAYITYAPQSAASALNPGRTIGRQLELGLLRRAEAARDRRAEMLRLLGEVGLDADVARALPAELSGGMCQRAALAIALAPSPRVLVADEPETGLDPILRRGVVELLVALAREHACGLLLISHHEDTVARAAQHVVHFRGGVP